MKIEFGCGPNVSKGFIGCDIRPFPGIKFVCNSWEIENHVQKNSVEEIYSRHFFEHLTFYEAELTLKVWYSILNTNGKLTIIVPDMLFHIDQWLNKNRSYNIRAKGKTDQEWSKAGFWGNQRRTEHHEYWDVHKSGYDFDLLKNYLIKYNFKNVERINNKPWHLHVQCYKSVI